MQTEQQARLQKGGFIKCLVCPADETFLDRPQLPWLFVGVEGNSPVDQLVIEGNSYLPPFYVCSIDCLKTLVRSPKFAAWADNLIDSVR